MNGIKRRSGPWLRNGNIFHPNDWRPISSVDLNMIFGASWVERSISSKAIFFSMSNIELFKRNNLHNAFDNNVSFYYWRGTGEQLGRIVYAMEISPIFVDVAVKRWEEFTGKKALVAKDFNRIAKYIM